MNSKRTRESGQAIVVIAFAFIGLLGFAALAIDGGMIYSDRRHAQNAADAGSLAGGGSAALILENEHIFYKHFNCNNLSAVTTAAMSTAENTALSNGYLAENITVDVTCNDNGAGPHPDKYLDVTTTISKTTQTAFAQIFYQGEVDQAVIATTRIRPRQPLVFGNAVVALNENECSGQSNGQGFHGGADVDVIGGGIFSNGCLRGDGNFDVDVIDGDINYFYGTVGESNFTPPPTQLDDDPSYRIPPAAHSVDPPDCSHPDAHNVSGSSIKGSTLAPGLYCVSGDIKVTNDNGSFSGTDVTIYMLDGQFWINGGTINISAPPQLPEPSPALPGMLLMFAPGNNNKVHLSGNSDSTFSGTILAPESDVDMYGTGVMDAFQCQIIGLNIELGGSATAYVLYDDANQFSKPTSIDLQK